MASDAPIEIKQQAIQELDDKFHQNTSSILVEHGEFKEGELNG